MLTWTQCNMRRSLIRLWMAWCNHAYNRKTHVFTPVYGWSTIIIRVIWVYCFPFNVIHLYTLTAFLGKTKYLTSNNYILPTISSDTPNSLESVAFECLWYPVGDKRDSSWHSTGMTSRPTTCFETRTKIWNGVLKIERSFKLTLT